MSSPYSPRQPRGASTLLIALALAGGLAGVIWLFRAEPQSGNGPQPAPAPLIASPATPVASAPDNPPAPEPAWTVEPVIVAHPTTRPASPPVLPAPAAVTRAFPSITGLTPDWRDFRPESLTVAPYPDLPVRFTRTALRDEGRYVTWIGRNPALPGASLVGVSTAQGYDAILVLPGAGEFSYHVRGEEVVVTEVAPGEESCGVDPVQPPRAVVPLTAGTILAVTDASGRAPLPDAYAETAPLKVDVLVAYDADTLAAAATRSSDPVGYIDGQMKAKLETSNLALSQSGVTAFVWRYLGLLAAPPYTRTGKTMDDLEAMASGGLIFDWVKTKRYQHGADQVLLLLGGEADYGGRAYAGKQVAVSSNDRASAVLRWDRSYQTTAHELAHNFGCHHDRAHYNVISPGVYGDPVPDADGFWCYGQMWTNPPIPGGADPGTSGTIMSYADYRIPYFSNPAISVQVSGLLVGWSWDPPLGTHQTGRVESDPKAAYNVRVLNEQAQKMSNISEEILPPAITSQPSGGPVQRGLTLTLGVTATGGGLSYQWMKGDAPIVGSTTASYSKTAVDADAGVYSVKITNLAGTVTSNSVTLTITAPPPPPPPPSGGGGGAPSLGFLGLLALVGLGRWWSARRE